jgi:hypothetical protein
MNPINVEVPVDNMPCVDNQFRELAELQLSLVGGGVGEVVLA